MPKINKSINQYSKCAQLGVRQETLATGLETLLLSGTTDFSAIS